MTKQVNHSKNNIGRLLEQRRQVAVIWCTDDVKSVRPDLTDDQAWEVLQECQVVHDCEIGFNWLLIEIVADDMFPAPGDAKTAHEGESA